MKKAKRVLSVVVSFILLFTTAIPSTMVKAKTRYRELTFRDFGLGDQEVYGETVRGTKEPITSWDGVAISGTFTFANYAEEGNSIKFGVDNANEGWDYLFEVRIGFGGPFVLLTSVDALKASSHGQSDWSAIADNPAKNTEMEFRATFTENEDGDLEVEFTVNGETTYDPAVFAKEDVAKYSYGMLVTSTTNTITIESTPETSEEPKEEYDAYTFSDLAFNEGRLDEGNTKTWNIPSYNKVAFTGKVAFGENNNNTAIWFGGASQGLGIFYSKNQSGFAEDALAFWDYSTGYYGWITDEEAGMNLAEEIQLTLKFDVYDETKLKVTVEIAQGNKTYTKEIAYAASASIKKSIEIVVQPGYVLNITSVALSYKTVEKAPISYNLRAHDHKTEQKYLVTGNANVSKNGVQYTVVDNAIGDPGDYTIATKVLKNACEVTYIQQVSLYILGDVNLDGKPGTEADLAEMKRILENNPYEAKTAAEHAADIDNDGNVGMKDVELLQSVHLENDAYPTYTCYTFSDLGFVEGAIDQGNNLAWEIGSYDKVAFTGKVAFGESNINTAIWFGGASQGLGIFYSKNQSGFAEDALAFWDYSTGYYGWITDEEAEMNLAEEIQLTLKFDVYDETKLKVTVEIAQGNKTYTKEIAYAASASIKKSIEIVVQPRYTMTIKSIKTEKNASLYDLLKKYHVPAQTYDYIGGNGVMPIVGFYGPYQEYLTDDIFQKVKDVGVNLVNYSPYDAGAYLHTDTLRALELATKYGLGWFVEDFTLNPKIQVMNNNAVNESAELLSTDALARNIGKYSYYDAFLGIHIEDEPTYREASVIESTHRILDYYLDVSKQLNSYTNLTGFINMAAEDAPTVNIYSHGSSGGSRLNDLYDEYWDQYTNNAGAQVFSSDDYPFNNGVLQNTTWADGYFRTLGKTRNESLEHQTPFWSYVQAGGDFGNDSNSSNSWAIPTEAETYWNVNTALAFGAKGISWFPLIQPGNMDGTDSNNPMDRSGLILSSGQKSTFYDYAKNINKQIAAVDEVLMKAISTEIVASGGYAQSEAAGDVSNGLGATTQIKASHGKLQGVSSTNDTYGALVGCFDYRDTEAFYVVNYDVVNSATITLSLDDSYDYRCIIDGLETYSTTATNTISLSLEPGTAALIVLEDRVIEYEATELSDYLDADGNQIELDAEPGYLFAGWFSSESCKKEKAITNIAAHDGKAYAKFVPDEVLTVKAQLNTGAQSSDEKISMRFVTSVDSLNYKTIGFKIVKKADAPVERITSSKKVFTLLSENYGSRAQTYEVSELFGSMATYFHAYGIWNIPREAFDVEYEVTPYWITLDGTKVYGKTAIKSVSQGLAACEGK